MVVIFWDQEFPSRALLQARGFGVRGFEALLRSFRWAGLSQTNSLGNQNGFFSPV